MRSCGVTVKTVCGPSSRPWSSNRSSTVVVAGTYTRTWSASLSRRTATVTSQPARSSRPGCSGCRWPVRRPSSGGELHQVRDLLLDQVGERLDVADAVPVGVEPEVDRAVVTGQADGEPLSPGQRH